MAFKEKQNYKLTESLNKELYSSSEFRRRASWQDRDVYSSYFCVAGVKFKFNISCISKLVTKWETKQINAQHLAIWCYDGFRSDSDDANQSPSNHSLFDTENHRFAPPIFSDCRIVCRRARALAGQKPLLIIWKYKQALTCIGSATPRCEAKTNWSGGSFLLFTLRPKDRLMAAALYSGATRTQGQPELLLSRENCNLTRKMDCFPHELDLFHIWVRAARKCLESGGCFKGDWTNRLQSHQSDFFWSQFVTARCEIWSASLPCGDRTAAASCF